MRAGTFVFTATSRPVRGWGMCEVLLNGQNKRVVSSDDVKFCYGYAQWIPVCEDGFNNLLSIHICLTS